MLAGELARDYAAMPADQAARSILFLCFSAEESGLIGSRYYVAHPVVPLAKHALMINFDMIGRIQNRRLAVYNTASAKGLDAWLEPFFAASDLEIQKPPRPPGGSDHMAFDAKGVPNVFAIIADFHTDYHTPRDQSWKINRVDAVRTVHLFRDIARAAATRAEPFVYVKRRPRRPGTGPAARPGARPTRAAIPVSFGIMPATEAYTGEADGVPIGALTPGGAAEKAGLEEGDCLVTWNGKPIDDIRAWMRMLMQQKPGDEVKVGILRGKKKLEKTVKLQGR